MKSRKNGFTLIEIMIVVAIVAVLTAIAIPSYQESIRKGNRADVRNKILDIAQMQERFYTNNTTYVLVSGAPNAPPAGWANMNFSGPSVNERKFSISVAAGATGLISNSFVITATADNGYSDPTCPVMTIDNLGVKTPAPPSVCW